MPEDHVSFRGETFDHDKSWHAIELILTGEPWDRDLPNGFPFAGKEVGEDLDYGPARILSPTEIEQVHVILDSLSTDGIKHKLDRDKLVADAAKAHQGLFIAMC